MLYQTPNPHGGDVYAAPVRLDFSANTNPFGTPPGVLEAVRASLGQVHQYPDPRCRALVEAIARVEEVPAEDVLCGAGAAELIYAWCAAARPRVALEPAPTFSEYALALARAGGTMLRHPLRAADDFALGRDFLDAVAREAPDAVFLCNRTTHRPSHRPRTAGGDRGSLPGKGDPALPRRVLSGPDRTGAEHEAAPCGFSGPVSAQGIHEELRHGRAAARLLPDARPRAAAPHGRGDPALERLRPGAGGGRRGARRAGVPAAREGRHRERAAEAPPRSRRSASPSAPRTRTTSCSPAPRGWTRR